jgi:hypothetical protein
MSLGRGTYKQDTNGLLEMAIRERQSLVMIACIKNSEQALEKK